MPVLHAALISGALALPRHAVFGATVTNTQPGVTISRVLPESAAAAAGLQSGDVVQTLAGSRMPDVSTFLAEVRSLHGGQTVAVIVVRNAKTLDLSVTLQPPPDESDPQARTVYGAVEIDGTLRRTLTTIPSGPAARRPAVLFIGGIGCYSVDVAAEPEDPYLRLAHDLSRAGFVTMRLEKSGVGDSQGSPCRTVDFASEEYSYSVALTALRADVHVDPERIYLFGHGTGTIIAPRLARTEEVAGIVAAEAVGRDWLEYEMRNMRRRVELAGSTPTQNDAAIASKYACMYRLLVANEAEPQIEAQTPACKESNGVYPVDAPYLQQLATLDIIGPWAYVNAPVLVIYGKSDFVTEEADHARIVEIVNQAHAQSATLQEIDGMDNLLYRAASAKAALDAFQSGSSREYDSDLSTTVVSWLCAHERC